MANIFVHFEPTGPLDAPPPDMFTGGLPPYIIPGAFIVVCVTSLINREQVLIRSLWLAGNYKRIRRRGELETFESKGLETL